MNTLRFLLRVSWRNLWRHGRRSLITATAMAVAVALCMAMLAWSDGMFDTMFEVMVENQLGHVQVNHPDYPKKKLLYDTVPDVRTQLEAIDALPGTVAAAPRMHGFALIGGDEDSVGGQLLGVLPERDRAVTTLADQVIEGEMLQDAAAHEVLLGRGLAEELGLTVGGTIVVVTQAADGSIGNDLYVVKGIVKTGNAALDRAGAILHLADLQELLVLEDQAHQLTVLTDDPDAIDGYADRLRTQIGSDTLSVQPWWIASPQTAEMMKLQDSSMAIMLLIVFFVAAFGVLNTMMMSVLERTRELGVLKAIGLRPGRMILLIVFESIGLATLASVIGLALGGVLDWYIITYGLDFSASMPDGMTFAGVTIEPVFKGAFRIEPVIGTLVCVYLVSVGASLLPAWRAARLAPVEAIRTE